MAKFKSKITDLDKGYKRIVQELGRVDGKVVKVGVQSGAKTNAGADMVTIAAANELGTETIPARPFMRQTFDKYGKDAAKIIANQINHVYDNKKSVNQAMGEVGMWYEGRVKFTITNGDFEPNAPATIELKGSSKPLIDTGQMRASIRYVVVNE